MAAGEAGDASAASGVYERIAPSKMALRVSNPIRAVVDTIRRPKDKKIIPLSLGDPTVFRNLHTPKYFVSKLHSLLDDETSNGYTHSAGSPAARAAVAARYSTKAHPLTPEDIVLTSGCSHALEMAAAVLLETGKNIVMPVPGFPLYGTVAEAHGAEVRTYGLNPDKGWEVDLEDLDSKIDENTGAIVINNPSNPCGSVFSKSHLEAILAIAEKHKVPIIADEIYGNLVFSEETPFIPISSLTRTVPVLTVGGIAKEFLVPGWRVGWIIVHDAEGRPFRDIRDALVQVSQIILGPNTLIQGALPTLLTPEGDDKVEYESYITSLVETLRNNAQFTIEKLGAIPGLEVIVPQGAMYVMVRIDPSRFDDTVSDDVKFSEGLLNETGVFVLPGKCFHVPNFFRVVFAAPQEVLEEAYSKIASFCSTHSV